MSAASLASHVGQSSRLASYIRLGRARRSPVARAQQNEALEKQLKSIKSKLDKATARALLKSWKAERSGDGAAGDELEPRDLKKLVKERGARQSGIVARQLAIDALSASISWYSAIMLASSHSEIPAQFLLFTLAIYQSSNALLDLTQLVQIGILTRRYADQSEVILRAVQELVDESGVGLIDKLRAAIDTAAVLKQLDEVLVLLKADMFGTKDDQDEDRFLRDLGAYLVLVNASSKKDGSWMQGIDSDLLFQAAAEFALCDSNDDGFVDAIEFKRLIRQRGIQMNDLEVDVAMEALDANGDKVIDFEEFVKWISSQVSV